MTLKPGGSYPAERRQQHHRARRVTKSGTRPSEERTPRYQKSLGDFNPDAGNGGMDHLARHAQRLAIRAGVHEVRLKEREEARKDRAETRTEAREERAAVRHESEHAKAHETASRDAREKLRADKARRAARKSR